MQQFVLEKHKFFPYIAWAIIGGFALFVYHLSLNMATTAISLDDSSSRLEALVKTPVEDVTDFTR